jgi:truncated hemoglobin YjbI
VKAFTGVDNYYFKHTVKRVHEGLGIERRQFSRFVELFVQAMQEEGVRSSDVEIVSRHLNRFADEVIEDDGT